MSYRVGVDIGGTFTDLVLVDKRGSLMHTSKLLTTPHDPADAVMRGLEALLSRVGLPIAACDTIIHGTEHSLPMPSSNGVVLELGC